MHPIQQLKRLDKNHAVQQAQLSRHGCERQNRVTPTQFPSLLTTIRVREPDHNSLQPIGTHDVDPFSSPLHFQRHVAAPEDRHNLSSSLPGSSTHSTLHSCHDDSVHTASNDEESSPEISWSQRAISGIGGPPSLGASGYLPPLESSFRLDGFIDTDQDHPHGRTISHLTDSSQHRDISLPFTQDSSTVEAAQIGLASSSFNSTVSNHSDRQLPYERPRVWEETQTARSFSLQAFSKRPTGEAFTGAHNVLRTMNPQHYQLPWGSRVVSIKCAGLQNIYLSIEHGVWSCPHNVTKRLQQLFVERRPDAKDKILFLFSVSGSKQYCGLAEVQGYDATRKTDFWVDGQNFQGAFVLRWVYCKFVSFEDIRKVDRHGDGDSVTQMWNGMHYEEGLGREVVQAYVEAAHTDNLLACHPGTHVNNGARRRPTNTTALQRGVSRQVQHGAALTGVELSNRTDLQGAPRRFSVPQPGMEATFSKHPDLLQNLRRLRMQPDGSLPPPPVFGSLAERQHAPQVQFMQVVVNEDGTIRPATASELCATSQSSNVYNSTPPSSQASFRAQDQYHWMPQPVCYGNAVRGPLTPFELLSQQNMEAGRHFGQAVGWAGRAIQDRHALRVPTAGTGREPAQDTLVPLPRYTRPFLHQLGTVAHFSHSDQQRFAQARLTVDNLRRQEMEQHTDAMAAASGRDGHGGGTVTETGFPHEHQIGAWVDRLVATPSPSPRPQKANPA